MRPRGTLLLFRPAQRYALQLLPGLDLAVPNALHHAPEDDSRGARIAERAVPRLVFHVEEVLQGIERSAPDLRHDFACESHRAKLLAVERLTRGPHQLAADETPV